MGSEISMFSQSDNFIKVYIFSKSKRLKRKRKAKRKKNKRKKKEKVIEYGSDQSADTIIVEKEDE